ncbi:hypothetical protein GL4_1317 [Methyloceanibacter caenitepidi]|uniref:Uncharacterized protein n=1 Tax=Methyloceanibacter caenitepidi TaxID=1384459 RepID=A0A0A8K1H6_9HYPH|nr:hypothetical protein GL4_1317 [Methyloceanibacter caenitepidi]
MALAEGFGADYPGNWLESLEDLCRRDAPFRLPAPLPGVDGECNQNGEDDANPHGS